MAENTTTVEKKTENKEERPKNRRERRVRSGGRAPRERREFEQRILAIRRVARVMKGGRRFSFSVTLAAGDMKGRVGVGLGKGADTALAIEKALRDAKKNMITISRTPESSIAHDVRAKFGASVIELRPAPARGIIAGGAVRTILELGGVRDISAKILSRSKNHLNNARATVDALKQLKK